jgi:toxin ParE1/3/4
MKLSWTPRARRDLRELIAFIAEDSLQAAEMVAERILKAAESLPQFPRSGRIGRVKGTRERVIGRTPYLLVYRVVSGRVRILRVYHSARKWPSQF